MRISTILGLLSILLFFTACGGGSSAKDSAPDAASFLSIANAPSAGSTPVAINQYVIITFSATIDPETVKASTIYITDDSNGSVASVLTVSGRVVKVLPDDLFLPLTSYRLVVTTELKDVLGRSLEEPFAYGFTTSTELDLTVPSLLSVTPVEGDTVTDEATIFMEFDENIAHNGATLRLEDSQGQRVPGTSSILLSSLRLIPDANLTYDETYTVRLIGTVSDLSGNDYNGTLKSWGFTVESAPPADESDPTLLSVFPAEGSSVSISTGISMEFSETIANSGTLLVKDINASVVNGTSEITDNVLRFNPVNDLIAGNSYTVTLEGTVQDLAGRSYVPGVSGWTFSVDPASATTGNAYARLLTLDIGVDLAALKVYKAPYNGTDYHHLVIGTEDDVKLYRVSVSGGVPSVTLVHTFALPSNVKSLDVREDLQYILVGTDKDGLYLLDGNSDSSTGMELVMQYASLGKVEGVSHYETATGHGYLYAVSKKEGLGIFEIPQGSSDVAYLNTVEASSQPIDVTAVADRVYLLNGSPGEVGLFDLTGNAEKSVGISSSMVKIAYGEKDASGVDRIYALAGSGKLYDLDLEGDATNDYDPLPYLQAFSDGKAFTTHTDTVLNKSYSYLSGNKDGILVRALADNDDVTSFDTPQDAIAAEAFGHGMDGYVAVLDKNGSLSIYNAVADVTAPTASLTKVGTFVTITFSEYLDPSTVDGSKFTLSTGTSSGFTLTDNRIVTFTLSDPGASITASGTIKDRVGNQLNGGVDLLL